MVEREARNQADFRNTEARNNEEGRADTLLAPSEVEPPSPHPGHEEDVREQPSPSRRGRWRWLIYLLILAVIGIGAWRFLAPQGSNEKHAPPEPQPVGAAKVVVGDIDETIVGSRNRHPAGDDHRPDPDQRTIDRSRLQGRPGRPQGRLSRPDRSSPLSRPRSIRRRGRSSTTRGSSTRRNRTSPATRHWGRQDSIALQQVADQQFLVQQDKGPSRRIRRLSRPRSSTSSIATSPPRSPVASASDWSIPAITCRRSSPAGLVGSDPDRADLGHLRAARGRDPGRLAGGQVGQKADRDRLQSHRRHAHRHRRAG